MDKQVDDIFNRRWNSMPN